ncbi:MAG: TonB-dependent receptor [Candidatus Kapabacteria bacterium]|jgi:outer membrane receptor for ferrienterochelin and colicin|nr:TonB-dependent receptor [Candidatus Kapabacteria bacterium]
MLCFFVMSFVLHSFSDTLFAQTLAPASKQAAEERVFKTKPTRKQILSMKFEELSALSLEELTELSSIVGVSSVDELLKLLVNTASKTNETLNDAPGVISVITAKEMELFGARTLADALNYVVSIQLFGTTLYQENITMRGDLYRTITSKHILILINGRPLRESLFGGIYAQALNGFPLASVEQIEVLRGPGSVLYGTNAFTGTVNIITKTSNGASLSILGGGNGTVSATGNVGVSLPTSLGEARIDAGLLYNNNNTTWNVPFSLQPIGNRPPARITYNPYQRSLSGMLTASLGGFKAQIFATDYAAATLGPEARRPQILLTNRTLNADIGYTHEFSEVLSASVNGTLNLYNTRHVEILQSNDALAELTIAYKPQKTLQLLLGGVAHARSGIGTSATTGNVLVPEYNQIWWSAYAEAQWQPLENLKLRVGAQFNKAVNIDADVSPRVAAIWNITSEFGIKAFYGQAFRAASGFENFTLSMNARGNPRLRPETNESLDGEIFWEQANMRIAAVYYRTWQSNLIAPRNIAPPGQPPNNVTQNYLTFQLEGAEFEAKYAPFNEVYILGSVSYQTNGGTQDGHSSRDITLLSSVMLKAGFGYDNKNGIAVSLFNVYNAAPLIPPMQMGAMPTPVVNPAATAFSLLSAQVNLDISEIADLRGLPHFILNLRGENLLNADNIWIPDVTRRINSLPMFPGRAFYGGITVKF